MSCASRASSTNEAAFSREYFIDVNDVTFFCRTMGEGDPLVVVHGGPGLSQDYLLPGLERLAKNHFVIFYDQRGGGKSLGGVKDETLSVETLVQDLENLRKTLGLEKMSLLGHSWGTIIAARYAIAHPEFVQKLILSNATPFSSEGVNLFYKESEKKIAPYLERLAALQASQEYKQGNPEFHEESLRMIFRAYCHLPESADKLNLQTSWLASFHFLKTYQLLWESTYGKPLDLHPDLKTLQIPTLVIHGDVDSVPPSVAQTIHESIPGSQYTVLENCGHFPYVEQPDAYFKVLEEFLK